MISGRIEPALLTGGIVVLALAGAASDVLRGKIYNQLTVPALLLGILASAWSQGWSGLLGAALAVVLGFSLYGWIFFVGALGAGDVKFLMALGAWSGSNGVRFVVDTALFAIVLGGIFGVISLALRGRLKAFLRKIARFLFSGLLAAYGRGFELEIPGVDRTQTLPFGVPIAVAAIWTALADPLVHWGLGLWAR